MAQTVTCTGRAFKPLTDPYTGKPLVVKMLATKDGIPKFFSPQAYSTYMRFGTKKAAYDAWARSEGVDGVRTGQPIKCAYTGEMLRLEHDETGYWFEGGFDPRRFYTREEFLYYAAMRDGKSPYAKPEKDPLHVQTVREKTKPVESHEIPMLEGSLETAGAVMEKTGFKPEKKTKVSMSVTKKAKAKTGKGKK